MDSVSETENLEGLFGGEKGAADGPPRVTEKFLSYKSSATGCTLRVRVVGQHVLWGNYLWNGALWMCDFIEREGARLVAGKTVLELGAGAGLPAILSVKHGAERVVVTDYPDDELIDNLDRNIAALLEEGAGGRERIVAKGFLWGSDVAPLVGELRGGQRFDVIVMCDVVFNHSEHRRLLASCRECLAPQGEIWCVFSHYRPHLAERDLRLLRLADGSAGEEARDSSGSEPADYGFDVVKWDERELEEHLLPEDRADSGVHTVCAYRLRLRAA